MSDEQIGSSGAESAPSPPTTADIARDTIESYAERDSRGSEPAPHEGAAAPPAPAAQSQQQAPTPQQLSDAEQLLREGGYVSPYKPDGREHYIPRAKVLKMIESGLAKRAQSFEDAKSAWEKEKSTLAEQAAQAAHWQQLMEGPDPRALLTRMAESDPRYRAFLTQSAAQPTENGGAPDNDPEPEPDVPLGNGHATYSLEGIKKLRAWDRRQIDRALDARLKADRESEVSRREALAEREQRDIENANAYAAQCRAWPGFKEHEPEILKLLQEDTAAARREKRRPMLTVEQAYIRAAVPKLTANHNQTREQVMRDLNGAPRSTAVGRTGPEGTRAPEAQSTKEIAARVLARATGNS